MTTSNPFQTIFDSQRARFASNVTRSYEWRIDQLDRMARMISENDARLQAAISKDFKTASQEKMFETRASLAEIEYTKSQLRQWMTPVEAPLPTFLSKTGHKGMVYRDPYGVALVIGPFNGPLTLLIHPAITALSAGNTCMLKVSEALVASSAFVAELVPRYFAPEDVAVVQGSREEITELLRLPFDFIFFTGSTRVGKVIMQAAAQNLTPVLLELGGQNPALVDETANIPDAAKKLAWGATAWGGQWCSSPGYAYVHESVVGVFVDECKKALRAMYGDDPKSNPDYSRVISPAAVKRLASLIDQTKVVHGGAFDEEAHYLAPTILYPVSFDDRIMQEEIFGPILPILTYRTLDEAFLRMRSLPKPLAAYVFSRDQGTIGRFLSTFSFGGGAVNQTNVHLFVETMPFGGIGNAGMGRYYGKYGFDSLTSAKSILISLPNVAIESLFPPYTPDKNAAMEAWFHY
jgi:aldehyde dehydrogenase (NAD+)